MNWNLFKKAKKVFEELPQEKQTEIANSVADKIVKKANVTEELSSSNLRRYCKLVEANIKAARFDSTGGAVNKIRLNILDNLPKDFHDDLKKGYSKDYLVKFFYGEPSFVKIWNDLGLDFNMFETLLDKEVEKTSN